jgi:hypothetical protein
MKNRFLIVVVLFLSVKYYSQGIISSNSFIQTCINKTQCFSINNSSTLFYDDTKNSFYLKIDFNKFKTGQDTLDDWLDDLSSTYLYFKGPLDKEQLQNGYSNHHIKTFIIHGKTFLNGIWHNQDIEMNIYSSEISVAEIKNNQNNYDNLKVNFALALSPKDFKIHKKPHHLKKTILIGVTLGRINLLQPGMQELLKEAYDHH